MDKQRLEIRSDVVSIENHRDTRTPFFATRREKWEEALTLPEFAGLASSLVGELAGYVGRPEDETREACRAGAERLAEKWRDSAPRADDEIFAFYERADAYLYDLTWWHSLAEDESALAAVEALEAAEGHRAHTALDFGSGIGSLGILFAKRGMNVSLAEINPALSEYARHRFERRKLSARFLDPTALPGSTFDFISAVDVLEHVPKPGETLNSLAAALRPGGTLFVNLPPEEDLSRPMHLWHGTDVLLEHLDDAGLWMESASFSSMTLRRGEAPRYSLGPGFEVVSTKDGKALVSERPLMAVRINSRAAEAISLLEEERSASELARGAGLSAADATAFLDGLVEKRIASRESETTPSRWPSVSVIVPARDRPAGTRSCVKSLLALDYPPGLLEAIVVDDASEAPLSEALSDLPVRVIRSERNIGQSAARNLAAGEARGEVLAFTDNDCVAGAGWLRSLVAPLCEPGICVSGGRTLSPPLDGAVSAFEDVRSPLDMGERAGFVGPGEPISYLPTCNLAADKCTLLRLGGFDEGMSLGEDADFVWRVAGDGGGVYYEPRAGILHHHRTRLSELLRRRSDYASSEADLVLRHPETRRTMMLPFVGTMLLAALPASPVSWLVSVALVVVAGVLLGAEFAVKSRRLRGSGVRLPFRKVASAVMRQHGSGLYFLGANVARYYSLPLLAASIFWPMLLPPTLLLMAMPAVVDHRRLRPKVSLPGFTLLYWLELAAYQTGVWRGCLERRTLRPLIPKLRPGR